MNHLYHITSKERITSIIKHGLLTNQRNLMTCGKHSHVKTYGITPIFLTSDPNRLVREQLTPSWIERHVLFVLKVDTQGLTLIDEYVHLPHYKGDGYTMISFHNIPTNKIIEYVKFGHS